MVSQIFVNLPVKDLQRSIDFFTGLGFSFNQQFTDENATCMIIGERMFAMLLTEPFFTGFSKKPVADAHTSSETIIALSLESREAVDTMARQADAAGARATATQDHGWMYQKGFEDPDGHLWEILFMDMSQMPQA